MEMEMEIVPPIEKTEIIPPIKKSVTFFPYNFINLQKDAEFDLYNPNLKLFELGMNLIRKIGSDNYSITHETNYFDFFRRIGKLDYFIIQHDEAKIMIGSFCVIMQTYKITPRKKPRIRIRPDRTQLAKNINFWFLSDLFIEPDHRKKGLVKFFTKMLFKKFYSRYPRAYTIVKTEQTSMVKKIFSDLGLDNIKECRLLVYFIGLDQMKEMEIFFVKAFGEISYLKCPTSWVKIFEPIDLYCLQHSTYANIDSKNITCLPEKSTICLSFPKDSPLEMIFFNLGIFPSVEMDIVSIGMEFFDWHEILTSNFKF